MKLMQTVIGGGAVAVLGAGGLFVAAAMRRQLQREIRRLKEPAPGLAVIAERFQKLRELMGPEHRGVLEAYEAALTALAKTRTDVTYVEERVTPVLDDLVRVLETGEELDLSALTDEFGRMTGDVLATVADKDLAALSMKERPRVVAFGR